MEQVAAKRLTCSVMVEKYGNIFRRLVQGILRHKKITAIIVIVVVAAGGGIWRVGAAKSKAGGYLASPAAYGDIASTVSANATVQATQETVFSFKNSGYVEDVYVTDGQFVKAGTVMAREQASDYQAQLAQAEAGLIKVPDEINQAKAALAQAQNNLALAQTTLARDEALAASGAISQSTLDSARNTYQNDRIQVQSAQSSLDQAEKTDALSAQAAVTLAKNNLAGCEITATMDGYVTNINGNTGEWTQGGAPTSSSSSSSSQFTITLSSNKLELLAEVNEADIAKVKTGDQITFTVDAFPNQTFTGRLTSLAAEAAAVQGVQYFQAYASIDEQSGLKAGMPAAINIISAQKKHVLVVPRAALSYAAGLAKGTGGSYLAVLSDGKQSVIPVQTGLETNSLVEITSGLQAGQRVVIGNSSGTVLHSSGTGQTQKGNSNTTGSGAHMMINGGPMM